MRSTEAGVRKLEEEQGTSCPNLSFNQPHASASATADSFCQK